MAFIQTTTCGGPLSDISTSTALSETLDAESASTSRSISADRCGNRRAVSVRPHAPALTSSIEALAIGSWSVQRQVMVKRLL